jgi:uncharacterized membrane protein YhaH (DUF805 family)
MMLGYTRPHQERAIAGNLRKFMSGLASWFGWAGRLRRRSLIWKLLVLALSFVVLFVAMEQLLGRAATLVLYPPFFAGLISVAIRRLHDQARGGSWLFLLLVPVLGPLVIAGLLILRRGTPGENQYGADPRQVGRDYLKVAVYDAD